MRAQRALSIAAALLAVFAASGVGAQEAIPETPPELRDFRLDPERAQPQPEPQPTTQPTVITPPTAVPTLPEAAPSRPEQAPTRRAQPTTTLPTTENAPTVAPDTEILPETPPAQSAAEPSPPAVHEATAAQPPESFVSWPIMVGLGLGGIALLAFVLWKRRRRKPALEPEMWEPVVEEQPIEQGIEKEARRPTAPRVAQPPAKKPSVTLGFIPEKATISFTSLTVRGQLQLINEGKAPAKNMQLRAGLMSASADQGRVIEGFHQNVANVAAEQLGEAQPGERIGMAIELSVPLTELQSFPLGDQQLLVPIIVANLSYSDGIAPPERAYIACMIGREATPPQPKMGPLRLDLGPRSFAPLGQRPVVA